MWTTNRKRNDSLNDSLSEILSYTDYWKHDSILVDNMII